MPRLYHCSSLYGTRQGLVKKAKRQDISRLFRQKLAVLHNASPISSRKGPRYASPFFKVSAETA